METQCVFCCVRNAFLCTFKLWVFKVVSALQAGDITLEAVLSFSSASLLLSPMRRFPHVGLRFTPMDGRNLVQVRRAVVTNLAAIRYHRWSSE